MFFVEAPFQRLTRQLPRVTMVRVGTADRKAAVLRKRLKRR